MIEHYREQQKRIVAELKACSPVELDAKASVVPIQADYKANPAICLTSVVFIPDETARDIFQTIVEPLQAIEPEHHYYLPDAMHLTIKNIRIIHNPPRFTQRDIDKVHQLFSRIIPDHPSFFFSLEEVIPFTTSIALIGYSDERLQGLVQALDTGLKEIGLPDDKEYVSDTVFFGNVTVCRYVRQPSRRSLESVEQMTQRYKGELEVKKIDLITCNVVCTPDSRTILHSYTLRNESTYL